MVDVDKIQLDLVKYFKIEGSVKIDPSTGVVDVDGDVELIKKIKRLPVKFGTVSGEFNIYNKNLVSLAGSPRRVGGGFYCVRNQLTSLEGAPDHVGRDFDCGRNQLTSLEGAPGHVGGDFYCNDNPLTSLAGAPDHVGRDFVCYNDQLTSLEGAPDHVGRDFWCTYNNSLPVLRLILYPSVEIKKAPPGLQDIINKYAGTQNPGDVLCCASELNEHGFEGNAEW